MKCTNCGAEIPDGNRFCTNCGSIVSDAPSAAQTCSKCGRTIAKGFSFCLGCGAPVSSGSTDNSTNRTNSNHSSNDRTTGSNSPNPGNFSNFTEIPRPAPTSTAGFTPVGSGRTASVVCWRCGAQMAPGADTCAACGADLNAPSRTRNSGSAVSTKSSPKNTLIIALVAVIGIAAALFITGALGGRSDSGSSQPAVAQNTPASEQNGEGNLIVTEPEAPAEPEEQDYLLPDSATRYLSDADLQDLSWRELCLARNEIFARHGRRFITPEIAEYFNSKDWYQPLYDEVTLSDLETANVNLIRDYENAHFGGSYY